MDIRTYNVIKHVPRTSLEDFAKKFSSDKISYQGSDDLREMVYWHRRQWHRGGCRTNPDDRWPRAGELVEIIDLMTWFPATWISTPELDYISERLGEQDEI